MHRMTHEILKFSMKCNVAWCSCAHVLGQTENVMLLEFYSNSEATIGYKM